ncbi:MAG: ribonuclease P protein component [Kiritimatiellae bacterium]|nr:ribonuclease P protein component [Kiritimatiellia bacterium]
MAASVRAGQPLPPDRGLPRERRLRRAREFEEAYRGRKLVGRHMVMFVREAPDAALRIGVVTGRRIGGAVQRNRWRRRLREVFRQERHRLQGGVDLVLVARASVPEPSFESLREDFLELACRAGLWRPEGTG